MNAINFDNPYLLLIAIPLLIAVLVPFFVAIRKENNSKSVIIALVMHLVIVVLVAFAGAGTNLTAVVTKTEVVVLADVSYSANRNLDTVNAYVKEVESSLPRNSEMSVVCFAKDCKRITDFGDDVISVKNSGVDDSATDILSALSFASTMFSEDAVKRIVIISDGKPSDTSQMDAIVSAVDLLRLDGVYVDAMYVDNNIPEGEAEVQISEAQFVSSTYLGHECSLDVSVQSNTEARAILTLYKNGEIYDQTAVTLLPGYSVINFDLDTSVEGENDYELEIESDDDYSDKNNRYTFTQTVNGKVKILLITNKQSDVAKAQELYSSNAEIDAYVNKKDVPCMLEELCKYDQIILSDVDVRTLNNNVAFVESLDKAVSVFGKSLITFGDQQIQNKEDEVLKSLEDMLPVKYGNDDTDPKLFTIVLDTSRSMENAYRYIVAKQAATYLLNLIGDNDYVALVTFSGSASLTMQPVRGVYRQDVIKLIEDIQPTQGTYLGYALYLALDTIEKYDSFGENQVIVISDGLPFTNEPDDPVDMATQMRAKGITVSTINTMQPNGADLMEQIASVGGGKYYYIEDEKSVGDIMLSGVADDLTETLIEKRSKVNVKRPLDKTVEGITSLPYVDAYLYSKAKATATTVLTTEYVKNTAGKEVIIDVPLCSYWSYGNGKVSTFTSSFGSKWASEWNGAVGNAFMQNVVVANTPNERVDYPYTLDVDYDGTLVTLSVTPAVINPSAVVEAEIVGPNGQSKKIILDYTERKYLTDIPALDTGKHSIKVTYTLNSRVFEASTAFHVPYSPEYNAFEAYDVSNLYKIIRSEGQISQDGKISLQPDADDISTYKVEFALPFLVLAVILFVADVIIRKLRWADVKSLFGRKG